MTTTKYDAAADPLGAKGETDKNALTKVHNFGLFSRQGTNITKSSAFVV